MPHVRVRALSDRRRGFLVSFRAVATKASPWYRHSNWSWGRCIPFLVAGPLGIVAIYFRMRMEESPAFKARQEAEAAALQGS